MRYKQQVPYPVERYRTVQLVDTMERHRNGGVSWENNIQVPVIE